MMSLDSSFDASSAMPVSGSGRRVVVLPDRVANQIAAGEVVERPVAVVKELVENSLDAGATQLNLEYRQGGKAMILVEDNGHGMDRQDALMALERHATSKISEAADLDRLITLGFRGEALPSIASVSRFSLRTRRSGDDAGTEVVVNGGKLLHVGECAMIPGTRIEVRHLFNSVPARRQFLRTDNTEATHIEQLFRAYAVTYPGVGWSIKSDQQRPMTLPAGSNLRTRVMDLFGSGMARKLLDLGGEAEGMSCRGLISPPGDPGRNNRHMMFTAINGRPVDAKQLNEVLLEATSPVLTSRRYPVLFLHLRIPPERMDVNVHPSKREVRFRKPQELRAFLMPLLAEVLSPAKRYPGAGLNKQSEGGSSGSGTGAGAGEETPPEGKFGNPDASATVPLSRTGIPEEPSLRPRLPATPQGMGSPSPTQENERVSAAWVHLGSAGEGVEVFRTTEGLVLMDVNAARQRIHFEEASVAFRAGHCPSQGLLFPHDFIGSPMESRALEDHREALSKLGLEVEPFGRNTFRITALPVLLDPGVLDQFLPSLLNDLMQSSAVLALPSFLKHSLRFLRPWSEEERKREIPRLPERLMACQQPLVSPFDRPTVVELPRAEIRRRFRR